MCECTWTKKSWKISVKEVVWMTVGRWSLHERKMHGKSLRERQKCNVQLSEALRCCRGWKLLEKANWHDRSRQSARLDLLYRHISSQMSNLTHVHIDNFISYLQFVFSRWRFCAVIGSSSLPVECGIFSINAVLLLELFFHFYFALMNIENRGNYDFWKSKMLWVKLTQCDSAAPN